MFIMSVDLGKARTGIAISDNGESFAFPKKVITEYNEEKLGEAIVYSDIAKQPNRKKCALLTWEGTKEVLERR